MFYKGKGLLNEAVYEGNGRSYFVADSAEIQVEEADRSPKRIWASKRRTSTAHLLSAIT